MKQQKTPDDIKAGNKWSGSKLIDRPIFYVLSKYLLLGGFPLVLANNVLPAPKTMFIDTRGKHWLISVSANWKHTAAIREQQYTQADLTAMTLEILI